jgi:hypothetical protein
LKTGIFLLLCLSLQPIPQQPGVTYGPQGERFDTYQTPSGAVTYDSQGNRIECYNTPSGGSVIYDDQGRRWESSPLERTP